MAAILPRQLDRLEEHEFPKGFNPKAVRAFLDETSASGGAELANSQSIIRDLCKVLGVAAPKLKHAGADNPYCFEEDVKEGKAHRRIDVYKRGCFVLEAKQGADPNRKNAFGHPVYFAGAGHGKAEQTLATLLDHGADLRATGPGGETVLFYAASASNWRAMDFLLTRGADPRQGRSRTGETLRDVVEDAARQRRARGVQGGRASDDDGLQDLLTR